MNTVIIVLSVLGALGGTLAQEKKPLHPPKCPVNEHYEKNCSRCQITCENMEFEDVISCHPTSACFCDSGYVRDSNGVCIKRKHCPPKCPVNEHYEKNCNRCQITCENMKFEDVISCPPTSACYCDSGYVRDCNGVCIKKKHCPPKCPVNEHYEKNCNRCQITCENMKFEDVISCPPTSACFCDSGYVRDSNGVCIKRKHCPPKCPVNEHYEKNCNRCQITCENMKFEDVISCPPTSACYCDSGYVRDCNGVCIKKKHCPPQCNPNERYLNNTVQCQITCRNMALEPYMGPCYPSSGCFCIPGYVRNDNGVCIRREDCPPPPCKKGEIYKTCGSPCPTTCESRGDTCKVCPKKCVKGCFCAGKTIRGPNGTCIDPKKCPPRTCRGKNEVFVNCPPTCPPTENCSNLWTKYDCCDAIDCCKPQCRCKPGYFRNSQNVCISAQACIKGGGTVKSTAVASATAEAGDASAAATATAGDTGAAATAGAWDTGAAATAGAWDTGADATAEDGDTCEEAPAEAGYTGAAATAGAWDTGAAATAGAWDTDAEAPAEAGDLSDC